MTKEHTKVNDTKTAKKRHKTSKLTGLLVPVKKKIYIRKMTKRIKDELDRGLVKKNWSQNPNIGHW